MEYDTSIATVWNDIAEVESPFLHIQEPSIPQSEDNMETFLSCSLLDLNANSNDLSSSFESDLAEVSSPPGNLYDVASSSSIDTYSLTSLDSVHNLVDCIASNSTTPEEPFSPPEPSVTSKLKSVLLSRQRIQTDSSREAAGCVPSTAGSGRLGYHNNTATSDLLNNNCNRNNKETGVQNTLKFPPCNVCGGSASGLHYGVNTCEPCKGFFTRYLRKREEYKCSKTGSCVTTSRLRGNCSACRLKKCLALGMSRKNSRLGRYSLTRRMETIMQVKKLEENTEIGNMGNASSLGTDQAYLTAYTSTDTVQKRVTCTSTEVAPQKVVKLKAPNGFSGKLVKSLVDFMEKIKPYGDDLVTQEQIVAKLRDHYDAYNRKIKLFGDLKTIPRDEYFNLLKGFGIEIDRRMMYLKQSANVMLDVIERYCNFAKQIPNFKSLSQRDQSNLLKSSRYDFFMILMHEGYLHEEQVFLAHDGFAFHREEVADKFFSRKLVFTVCEMYHRLQKLKLSKSEKALLIAVCLVFTDRCTLEDPALVEQIQLSITHLLRNQLEKTCKESASRRFTKIIDCLVVMRETSELFLKEYNQLCNDENVIEEVPIMTELLFEDS